MSDACSLPCDATADASTSDSDPLRPPSVMKAISRLPMASVSFITANSLNLTKPTKARFKDPGCKRRGHAWGEGYAGVNRTVLRAGIVVVGPDGEIRSRACAAGSA